MACHRCLKLATAVERITVALMVNSTLQKLSLHKNNIGDDGMSVISEAQ